MKHKSVSLVVIAKNESRCIERCLNSVRPLVDQMLVLDTGSTDGTVELAQSCGAEVMHFKWCDDFSAARNSALEHSLTDWNLILDADEWLEVGGHRLLQDQLQHAYIGLTMIKSIDQSSGVDQFSTDWLPRLLPKGVFYRGKIHEQPFSSLPRRRIELTILHDGYTRVALESKRGRNRVLLVDELRSTPDDPYLLYQLGKDYEVYGEIQAAAEMYLKAQALLVDSSPYVHDLVIRAISCLSRSSQFDHAIKLMDQYALEYQDSPDFYFAAGNAFLDKGLSDPLHALDQWLPRAIEAWRRCLEIGEQPALAGSVIGRGSFLAAFNLHVVFNVLGDSEKSDYFLQASQKMKSS
jgi:glycosyltransferase involved in cell wall biosynthesis